MQVIVHKPLFVSTQKESNGKVNVTISDELNAAADPTAEQINLLLHQTYTAKSIIF